ncbi:hypothetical protein [Bradyrhizobium sp. JR3.5]
MTGFIAADRNGFGSSARPVWFLKSAKISLFRGQEPAFPRRIVSTNAAPRAQGPRKETKQEV